MNTVLLDIFADIAHEVGAYLMVDMAHIAGLVAAGLHMSPVPYADVVTTTTHKTLRGPRGGMILCKSELAKAIDKAVRQHGQEGSLHYRHRFLVAERDGYLAIGVEMISYIHSEGGLTRLFLKDKRRFVVEQSLDELEKQLDPSAFFRANRQHIVHITSVKRLSNWFNRKTKVIIAEYPDKEIIISKEKTPGLKHWMDS